MCSPGVQSDSRIVKPIDALVAPHHHCHTLEVVSVVLDHPPSRHLPRVPQLIPGSPGDHSALQVHISFEMDPRAYETLLAYIQLDSPH